MLDVLVKAMAFVLTIVLGYTLKKSGLFGKEDYKIVSKIAINITLPCAVISGFAGFKMDYSLFWVLLIGLVSNLIMIGAALFLTKRESVGAKLFYIFSLSGHNIGAFTLPFVQSFLGPAGVVTICMFDVGNSIMCTGMTFALAASFLGDAEGNKAPLSLKEVFNRITQSKPFCTYMVMMALVLLGIKVPEWFLTLIKPAASANAFVCMLMIGLMFEINMTSKTMSYLKEIVLGRYLYGVPLAAFFVLAGPFSKEINMTVAAGFLAPSTAIGPIFLEKLKGDVALSGVANSVTIVISVILLTAFFVLL